MKQTNVSKILSQRQPAIYSNEKKHCSKKCTKTRCTRCGYIKEGSFHTFKITGDIFYLKENMTCERRNLIYMVICFTSNEVCIGETGEGKQGLLTEFDFINNTSVNRNISNLNARNTFKLVEKDNSKYFHSSNYIRRINT